MSAPSNQGMNKTSGPVREETSHPTAAAAEDTLGWDEGETAADDSVFDTNPVHHPYEAYTPNSFSVGGSFTQGENSVPDRSGPPMTAPTSTGNGSLDPTRMDSRSQRPAFHSAATRTGTRPRARQSDFEGPRALTDHEREELYRTGGGIHTDNWRDPVIDKVFQADDRPINPTLSGPSEYRLLQPPLTLPPRQLEALEGFGVGGICVEEQETAQPRDTRRRRRDAAVREFQKQADGRSDLDYLSFP